MQTDKLVTYRKSGYPQLPGGSARYISDELAKVQNALLSTQTVLKNIETSGTVASKAGAVSVSDLVDGRWQIIHDTVNNTVGLYTNVGGTLFSVMLT